MEEMTGLESERERERAVEQSSEVRICRREIVKNIKDGFEN